MNTNSESAGQSIEKPEGERVTARVLVVDYVEGHGDSWGQVRLIFPPNTDKQQAVSLASRVKEHLTDHSYKVSNNVLEQQSNRHFVLSVQFMSGASGSQRKRQSVTTQGEVCDTTHFLSNLMLMSIRKLTNSVYLFAAEAYARIIRDSEGKIVNHRLIITRRMNSDQPSETIDIKALDEPGWHDRKSLSNLKLIVEPSKACHMSPVVTPQEVRNTIRNLTGCMAAYLVDDVTFIHDIA